MKSRIVSFCGLQYALFLTICLAASCGRGPQSPESSAADAAEDSLAADREASDGAAQGVMQDRELVRSVEELRRDSVNLRRIDSLALRPRPAFATPREAVEAQLRAYVAVDAPLMFHVCESGLGRPDAQSVLDYQHMMEGLSRRSLLPTSFSVVQVGEEGDVCPVEVDLVMPDGTTQPMHTEAFRLPTGRWRAVVK